MQGRRVYWRNLLVCVYKLKLCQKTPNNVLPEACILIRSEARLRHLSAAVLFFPSLVLLPNTSRKTVVFTTTQFGGTR